MSNRISPLLGGICSEALVALMSPAWLGASPVPPGATLLVCSLPEMRDPQQESFLPHPAPCVPALAGCLFFPSLPPTLLSTVIGVRVATTGTWP